MTWYTAAGEDLCIMLSHVFIQNKECYYDLMNVMIKIWPGMIYERGF